MSLTVRFHPGLPKYEQQFRTLNTFYRTKHDINWAGVLWFCTLSQNCSWNYSRITSTKSPPFCVTTFRASLCTCRTAILPQSHDFSSDVSRRILAPSPHSLISVHKSSRTCDISLGSLILSATIQVYC